MKKIVLSLLFSMATFMMFAQCGELFISEYVEGGNNNKALEIYNPTNAAIDLSAYSVGRFSNGATSYTGIDLPAEMLGAYETYVIVLDKRDPDGSGNEYPVWDGYQVWDVCVINGEVLLYPDGDTVYCVQTDSLNNFEPIYGTEYNEFLDLQGKADAFLCPVYNVNNAMYFNGNDAVALVKGSTILADGSNLLDVVGVIGEDPGQSWVDVFGNFLTRDKTLERKPDIGGGTGIVAAALQDTFAYVQYNVWGKNNFYGLGEHDCVCDPDFVASAPELNQVEFKVFPNPASSELTVQAAESIERIEVYNLLGERVIVQNYGENAFHQVNVNIQSLETGMYVISLFFDDEKQSVQKFTKR